MVDFFAELGAAVAAVIVGDAAVAVEVVGAAAR